MDNLLALFFAIITANIALAGESIQFVKIKNIDSCAVRAVIETPESNSIKADVLFFIGYGDRADNHSPLFRLLSKNGYRVISFDYPSHGETRCSSLNYHDYSSLMEIAKDVEKTTRTSDPTPLILGGWSTGGLLAVRMMQTNALLDRVPKKMFLLAPGVSVYPLVGGDGIIRQETLLSNPNPPHRGPITPVSPLLTPLFSAALISNSIMAQHSKLPHDLETLLIVGSDTLDLYAKTVQVRVWYRNQKMLGSKMTAIQCPNSRHEIDNEVEPIGQTARYAIVRYLEGQFNQNALKSKSCRLIH